MSVTKKEIADHLGISRAAVSMVLNNAPSSTISQETRDRILKAAKELGYREVTASPKIGYILYNRLNNDPRYMMDLKVTEEIASEFGYKVVFLNIKSTPPDYQMLQSFLKEREVAGVIVTGDVDTPVMDLIEDSGVPSIFYSVMYREGLDVVIPDFRSLTREATKQLLSLNHRKVAFLTGGLHFMIHMKGLDGYKEAFEEMGLPFDKSLVQSSKEEDGYEMCTRLQALEIEYTAAVCSNTIIQFGAIQWLKEHGITVPAEVSLVGLGYTELVKASVPPLTTLGILDSEKEKVIRRLIEKIQQKDLPNEINYLDAFEWREGGTVSFHRLK